MGTELIKGVYYYPLEPILTTGGKVMHAVKGLDANLSQFGECYFSTADPGVPKAWKKHLQMTCNLFVPRGTVKFVFYDDRANNCSNIKIAEFVLSENNYGRLVIQPGIWFGFACISENESLIMNVCDIIHDPQESLRLEPESAQIPYEWKFNL